MVCWRCLCVSPFLFTLIPLRRWSSRGSFHYILALEGPASFALLSCSSRRRNVVSRSSTEAEFFLCFHLSSPRRCLFLKFGSSSSLGFACSVERTAKHALLSSEEDSRRNFAIFPKLHRINVAGVCETVNNHEDAKLSYINTKGPLRSKVVSCPGFARNQHPCGFRHIACLRSVARSWHLDFQYREVTIAEFSLPSPCVVQLRHRVTCARRLAKAKL